MILTDQHQQPPRLVETDSGMVSSAALIKQGNVARLSICGLYRHESKGPGPYSDWEMANDSAGPLFIRQTRALTPDEIDARRQYLQELRSAERQRRQTETFLHDGHLYPADLEESIPKMTAVSTAARIAVQEGTTQAFEKTLGTGWRDNDGVARITTAAGMVALLNSYAAWIELCDRASQTLKTQINAAGLAEFDALETKITDDASWPS